jgi:thioesterase domain-containing protein
MAGMAVDFFRAQDSRPPCPHPFAPEDTRWEEDAGWHHWTGQKPRLHFTTGSHMDMLKPPNVSNLAAALRIAMDRWLQAREGKNGPTDHGLRN